MKPFYIETLEQAGHRLINEIGLQTQASQDVIELKRLQETTRALCDQVKAIECLEAHNQRLADSETEKTYTRYEDLPPLRPEERVRLEQQFIALMAPEDIEDFEAAGDDASGDFTQPLKRH